MKKPASRLSRGLFINSLNTSLRTPINYNGG